MGDSQSYFFPSLKNRFATHDICALDYPNPKTPHIDEWTELFQTQNKSHFDLVIAHSLGGTFAWSLLSRGLLTCDVLVTMGSSPGPKDDPGMQTFLKYPLDYEKIRTAAKKIIVVQSMDDPWTIPEYGIVHLKHSKGTGLFYADKGHFETEELPEDVFRLLEM